MTRPNAGRSGRRYTRLLQHIRATETHCYRCGQPINWAIPYRDGYGNTNPNAGTLEHKQPLSHHPELAEDPGNLAASHLHCNLTAGNRTPKPTLGTTSRQW